MESPYRLVVCGWLCISSFAMMIVISSNVLFDSGYKQAQSDLRFESQCKDLTQ